MIRAAMAAALIVSAAPALAEDLGSDPPWAHIRELVRPEYPAIAIDRKRSGVVDIVGTVAGGQFLKIFYVPADEESKEFIPELARVLPQWIIDTGSHPCRPTRSTLRVRAEFMFTDGEPRVFIHHAKEKPAMAEPALDIVTIGARKGDTRPLTRTDPGYPRAALEANLEAAVFASAKVSPEGKVTEVVIWDNIPLRTLAAEVLAPGSALPARFAPPRAKAQGGFDRETIRALSQWTFDRTEKGFVGCHLIQFNLRAARR